MTSAAPPAESDLDAASRTVRIRERETPGSSMALLRSNTPSAPFTIATYQGAELDIQTMLAEASAPGQTFDDLYLGWWLWIEI
ncbi:hypothetical protein [Nocardia sp. NPDC051981]|uniref:hypothetical protein n=1 Tax=Nocardia sp. NPDC051981 TaxID=3155417 RepID=UPI0034226B11